VEAKLKKLAPLWQAQHHPHGFAAEKEDPCRVDGKNPVPVVQSHFDNRLVDHARGIVDDDIQPAKLLYGGSQTLPCGAFPGLDVRRLKRTPLFADRFIGVVRAGHHALRNGRLDIEAFTELRHVWVSMGSEPYYPVAEAMADQGRRRRIAMTVPGALSVALIVANSDLVGVMPARLPIVLAVCSSLLCSSYRKATTIAPSLASAPSTAPTWAPSVSRGLPLAPFLDGRRADPKRLASALTIS